MPLVRIAMRQGKPAAYRRAVADEVHEAIVEVAKVPLQDRFQILTEYTPEDLIYDPSYLDIQRSDDIIIVQITLNQRPTEMKQAIYATIASRLSHNPGVRPEDVMVSLVPVAPEDWSFGNGKAQYVKPAS